MGLVESVIHWILCKLFKYRDIYNEVDGKQVLYLRRWFIYLNPKYPDFRIFLHNIRLSDHDRSLHDHPWDFKTFIIKGGYKEHLEDGSYRTGWSGRTFENKAEHVHRLELKPGQSTWTILKVGRARRVWGFHDKEKGWVDWRTYLGLPPDHPDSPEDVVTK